LADVTFSRFRVEPEFISTYSIIAIELLLAVCIGGAFLSLGAGGGAWILGGIAAGALVFSITRDRTSRVLKPNHNARKIGQLLVGLTVGFSIQHSDLTLISAQLPILLLLTLFLLGSGVGVGYLYARVAKTDLLTGLLATTPGNIGVMASIAADYGRNPSLVSMVQLMRFTAITCIIPLISHVSQKTDAGSVLLSLTHNALSFQPVYLIWLVSLLAVAAIAVRLGTRLRIPVAGLLCAIAVGTVFNAVFNLLPWFPVVDFSLPPVLNLIGQILLGLTIGEYWGISPRLRKGAIVHALIPVLLTFLTGLMAAGLAMLLTSWDGLTCLLVTAPGGSPEMIWIALGLDRNVEIVTAGHLVRLIAINVSLPILVSLARYLDHRTTNQVAEEQAQVSTA
jgi:hypothetical protein